jgi:hypothetical protein
MTAQVVGIVDLYGDIALPFVKAKVVEEILGEAQHLLVFDLILDNYE